MALAEPQKCFKIKIDECICKSPKSMHVLPRPNNFLRTYPCLKQKSNPTFNDELQSSQFYKLYNTREHSLEWLHLNQNQILTSRQTFFQILKSNSLRIGLNALANRLASINGKIELSWLNLTYESFKIKCKILFITY